MTDTNNISKIIYINLKKRKDRKEEMETCLSKLNIPFERFEAIQLQYKDLIEGKYKNFHPRISRTIKLLLGLGQLPRALGIIGCYLSHYFVHKKAYEEGWGNYLILEDDCSITQETIDLLNEYLNIGIIPEDWDIIRSNWNSHTSKINKYTNNNWYSKFADNKNFHFLYEGAHFQLCKGKSTRKIVEYLEKDVVFHIDALLSTKELNVYHCKFKVSMSETSKISNIPPPKDVC